MTEQGFRLPGCETALDAPAAYLLRVLRNFDVAAAVLGASPTVLVARFGADGPHPDYRIETVDRAGTLAFSGATHDPLPDDESGMARRTTERAPATGYDAVREWMDTLSETELSRGAIGPGMDAHGVGSGQ